MGTESSENTVQDDKSMYFYIYGRWTESSSVAWNTWSLWFQSNGIRKKKKSENKQKFEMMAMLERKATRTKTETEVEEFK